MPYSISSVASSFSSIFSQSSNQHLSTSLPVYFNAPDSQDLCCYPSPSTAPQCESVMPWHRTWASRRSPAEKALWLTKPTTQKSETSWKTRDGVLILAAFEALGSMSYPDHLKRGSQHVRGGTQSSSTYRVASPITKQNQEFVSLTPHASFTFPGLPVIAIGTNYTAQTSTVLTKSRHGCMGCESVLRRVSSSHQSSQASQNNPSRIPSRSPGL